MLVSRKKIGIFLILNICCSVIVYYTAKDKSLKSRPPRFHNVYSAYDLSTKEDCDYNCQLQVQQLRRDTVSYYCEEMGRHQPYKKPLNAYDVMRLHLNHIYVLDELQIMYCSVPKAGSSNWKRILLTLSGVINNVDSIHQYKIHSKINENIKLLSNYPLREILHKLRHYKKFMFSRDPFSRLLSAYRNKIERSSSPFRKTWAPIMKKQWFRVFRRRPSKITFTDFAEYLKNSFNSLDRGPEEHWREMYRLCEPCSIGYDFLGKIESVERDSQFVLDHLFNKTLPKKKVYFMKASDTIHFTGSADEEIMSKYYHSLPKKTLQGLYKRYEPDFQLFNYPKPLFMDPYRNGSRL